MGVVFVGGWGELIYSHVAQLSWGMDRASQNLIIQHFKLCHGDSFICKGYFHTEIENPT